MIKAYSVGEDLEGSLGDPPSGIKAASSYLLFNSSTNPYQSHHKEEPLELGRRTGAGEETPLTEEDEEGPTVNLGGTELLNRLLPTSYAYR